jgi:hypothetical protein
MKNWHELTNEAVEKIALDALTKAYDYIYLNLGVDVSNAFTDIEKEALLDVIWDKLLIKQV